MSEIIVSDILRGDFGGEVSEMGVRANIPPRSFEIAREQTEDIMRSTLVRSGCFPAVRITWEDGFAPTFDDDGNETGEQPMKLGYAFGDRLSTDRPPKHGMDRFYDEAGVFAWELAHLR